MSSDPTTTAGPQFCALTAPASETSDATSETTPQTDPTPQNPTQPNEKSETLPPTLTPTPELTPRQLTAISLLVMGRTITATASILGVNRWTIHQWKKDPAFAAALHRHRDDLHRTTDARIRLLLLQTTQAALDSLHVKDAELRYRHCFRLLSLLRPYRTALRTPEPDNPTTDV